MNCLTTSRYSPRLLAAYKSFEGFRSFDDGYVESLQTAQLNQEGVHVYVAEVLSFISEIKTRRLNSCVLSSSGSSELATGSELRSKRVMSRSSLDFRYRVSGIVFKSP